jgi:hypothetical protein
MAQKMGGLTAFGSDPGLFRKEEFFTAGGFMGGSQYFLELFKAASAICSTKVDVEIVYGIGALGNAEFDQI